MGGGCGGLVRVSGRTSCMYVCREGEREEKGF